MENDIYRSAKRGIDKEDRRWFSEEAIEKLGAAQHEVKWLLDRGYKMGPITDFVGAHYQFSTRQRSALQRATASTKDCICRRKKLLNYESISEGCLNIDGFNLIITLEVALSGGTLIQGNDGAVRDLAGLRGTYKLIDKTEKALLLFGDYVKVHQPTNIMFYLDAPVSNSGRLKERILKHSQTWDIPTNVDLVANADTILSEMDRVVTSDSIILDRCLSWFNITLNIIEDYISDARIISLNKT